jgi:hypothetical protein
MNRTPRSLLAVVALSAGLSAACVHADDAPLKGPPVSERDVPGVVPSFGEPGEMQRRMGERLPPQAVREAIRSAVLADDADPALKATPEQKQQLETIVADFEKSAREFRQANAKQVEELRRQVGPRGPRDGGAETPETPERAAAREKLREIQAQAPKPEDALTKVWAVLRPEQKKAVETELSTLRDKMARERQEDYVRRNARRAGPEGGPMSRTPDEPGMGAGPGPRGPGGGRDMDDRPAPPRSVAERRERLLMLFDRMTPDQQMELLRRLEDRDRDGARGPGGPPRERRGQGPGGPGQGPGGDRERRRDRDRGEAPPPPPPAPGRE